MKTHLLVALAATTLGGCAMAQQATTGFTQSVTSLVQRVSAGVRPATPQAAPASTGTGDDQFRREYAMALTGDREAMVEVAQMFGRGSHGIARDDRAMVEWLRQASELDHAGASYQ